MQWLCYLFVVAILVFLIGFSYSVNKPNNVSIMDRYLQYISNNSTAPPPLAFTHAKVGNNKYENYYFDSITGNFVAQIQEWPINLDGTKYDENLQHGIVIETTDGFAVSGVLGNFSCPDNNKGQWVWDKESKVCKTKPLCNGNADVNFIKGLTTYHQSQSTVNTTSNGTTINRRGGGKKFHDRIYATCMDHNGNFTIDACQDNMIFNQKERQAVVPNESPCDYYDICMENVNNYKHRTKIGKLQTLAPNEYYVCVNGISELKSCMPPLVYNTSFEACQEVGPCWDMDDGTTAPIAGSNSSYYLCKNQEEYTVNCSVGVYAENGSQKLECVNTDCGLERYEDSFSNSFFHYPLSAWVCKKNKMIKNKCHKEGETKHFVHSIQQPSLFYNETKFNFYDEEIEYFSKTIKYTNFGETVCVDLDESNIKDYTLKDTVLASYNPSLGKEQWNFLTGRPIVGSYNYFNIMGNIYRLSDNIKIGRAEDYVAMMGANSLYSVKNLMEKSVDTENGIVTSFHTKDPNRGRFKDFFRIGSFAHMLFPCGFDTYRMLVYDQINFNWLILDWQQNSLVDATNIKLGQFIDSGDDRAQKAKFTPPRTTLFDTVIPSNFSENGLSYHISSCTWDRQFVDLTTVVRPHFILPLKFLTLSDLNAHKSKVVTVIKDEENLDLENMLHTIAIVNDSTSTRRSSGQTVEEYFDEKLDDRIRDLILEPARVCLELNESNQDIS